MIGDLVTWFSDPLHWSGEDGVPNRLFEHVWYSGLSLVIAAVIALPARLASGHTRRGRGLGCCVTGRGSCVWTGRGAFLNPGPGRLR